MRTSPAFQTLFWNLHREHFDAEINGSQDIGYHNRKGYLVCAACKSYHPNPYPLTHWQYCAFSGAMQTEASRRCMGYGGEILGVRWAWVEEGELGDELCRKPKRPAQPPKAGQPRDRFAGFSYVSREY